jgi:hypothetical protein
MDPRERDPSPPPAPAPAPARAAAVPDEREVGVTAQIGRGLLA